MNTAYTVFPLQSSQGLGGKPRGEPGSRSQQPAQCLEPDTKSAPRRDAVGTRAVGGQGQENPHTCTGAGGTLTSPVPGPSVIAPAGRETIVLRGSASLKRSRSWASCRVGCHTADFLLRVSILRFARERLPLDSCFHYSPVRVKHGSGEVQ